MNKEYYTVSEVADILSISKQTLRRWDKNGKLVAERHPINNYRVYHRTQLHQFEEANLMFNSKWEEEQQVKPTKKYNSIELFAGAGGLALGLEMAGFNTIFLNEINKDACATIKANRPYWNIQEGDVSKIDFTQYYGKVDLISGGFPCQAFSYAGKKLGFEDTRGTLFYQFARAIKEINPKIFLAENVRGLLNHDRGNTVNTIKSIISDLGYKLVEPKVLKAIFYKVPQKRERLFMIGIRNDLTHNISYNYPSPYKDIMNLGDALKAGRLYHTDVESSEGQKYTKRKEEILSHVPPGGYWRDLSDDLQREYMKGSYFLGGGKTGMARRLSWDEPSLTLTTAPAQKQTERCHPDETRPLTIKEYARIQTFPDDWIFRGSLNSIYKQIGNAVPVNLALSVGKSLVKLLNDIETRDDQADTENALSYVSDAQLSLNL